MLNSQAQQLLHTLRVRVDQLDPLLLRKVLIIILAVLGVLLLVLFFSLGGWLKDESAWPISTIEYKGRLHNVDQIQLEEVVDNYLPSTLMGLDMAALKTELESVPWVYDVLLRKVWPSTLVVELKEQRPIARWGDEQLLNQKGEIFYGTLSQAEREKLPLLSSPEGDKVKVLLDEFMLMHKQLLQRKLLLTELHADARGSWDIRFSSGLEVKLGRENRVKRLQRFLYGYDRVLAPYLHTMRSVDLRYTNGFTVKWKGRKPSLRGG